MSVHFPLNRYNHEEGYERGEDNEGRDQEEQQNIREAIHRGAVLWVEPSASWSVPCEVHGDDEEHLGWDVQTDGVQSVSRIEVDCGNIGKNSIRGMGFGY